MLVNEYKPARRHEIEFNSAAIEHLSSAGIYFYQLKTSDYIETKKMTLIKSRSKELFSASANVD